MLFNFIKLCFHLFFNLIYRYICCCFFPSRLIDYEDWFTFNDLLGCVMSVWFCCVCELVGLLYITCDCNQVLALYKCCGEWSNCFNDKRGRETESMTGIESDITSECESCQKVKSMDIRLFMNFGGVALYIKWFMVQSGDSFNVTF